MKEMSAHSYLSKKFRANFPTNFLLTLVRPVFRLTQLKEPPLLKEHLYCKTALLTSSFVPALHAYLRISPQAHHQAMKPIHQARG